MISILAKASFVATLGVSVLLGVSAFAQTPPSFDSVHANAYFQEAHQVSEQENGRLWGRKLYGPMMFVDYRNRSVIANQQDAKNLLHREGDVFVGKMNEDALVANTSVDWSGTHWTVMIWQMIPEDRLTREKMFAHEMFHRIQGDLKLNAFDALNPQLDTVEGRLWLQLEWRALAAAILEQGSAQNQAVKAALAFRKYRQSLFPGSTEKERSLEIAEGVPEYTGLAAASPDLASARWAAAARLINPDLTISFVRSFAYTSGPAYGLLLDQRLPGWRAKLKAPSDFGRLLASTVKGAPADVKISSVAYGLAAIRNAETDRNRKLEITKAHYRKLLVENPTLTLASSEEMNFTFNPSTMVALDDAGTVYPTLTVTGRWGKLEVTGGALRPNDMSRVIVSAPTKTSGSHAEGPGWTLDLLSGWRVSSIADSKNFTVQKN